MSLKVEKVDFVSESDLNDYIKECLGREWCIQQNVYAKNGSLIIYDINLPEEWEEELVKEWLESPIVKFPGKVDQPECGESVRIRTDTILNVMCEKGFLKEGELYVHICW